MNKRKKMEKIRHVVLEYLGIVAGCCLVSIAFAIFINPYKLVPGGVFGTSIVLHNLFPSIQVGTFGYMIGIPLLIMSYFLLGKGIGARTLVATLVSPFVMNFITLLAYPDVESMQALDPSKLLGGMLDLSDNIILAAILGPVLMGVGEGLIMNCKATSGGSDIVAMIIHKYLRVKFSNALLAVDFTVIMFGLVVIGLGFGMESTDGQSLMLTGYSLIAIFVATRTLAYFLSGSKQNKLMFIITDKNEDLVRDYILNDLDRTATVIPSEGLYSQKGKQTLMMVVSLREVDNVTSSLKEIDPTAFVIITDAYDTFGLRWKALPDKHSLQLS